MLADPTNPNGWTRHAYVFVPVGFKAAANAITNTWLDNGVPFPQNIFDTAQGLRPITPGTGPATHLQLSVLVHTSWDLAEIQSAIPAAKIYSEPDWDNEDPNSILLDAGLEWIEP